MVPVLRLKRKKKLVGSGNNLEDMKNQEFHFESLKVEDVRYESASQRRCLNKDVYFEPAHKNGGSI